MINNSTEHDTVINKPHQKDIHCMVRTKIVLLQSELFPIWNAHFRLELEERAYRMET